LLCGDGGDDRQRTFNVEHTVYQTTNDQDWIYKTKIGQITIPWDSITKQDNVNIEDFNNIRCGFRISLKDPSASDSSGDILVAHFDDALLFTVSSHDGASDLLQVEADRLKWIGYVGQPMTMALRAVGTLPNNVEWSVINPDLLDIQIRAMDRGAHQWGTRNLTNLMRHAVDQWTGSGIDNQNGEVFGRRDMKSADVVMLTANPMKRTNYHFVVVAYEKTGDQSASVEIEVNVLRAQRVRTSTAAKGEVLAQDHGDEDEWASDVPGEHGSGWIVWWIIGTVVLTLSAVFTTFIVLKRKHFGSTKKGQNQGGIEMNKVNYHTVKKHTIKPAIQDTLSKEEQGILTI